MQDRTYRRHKKGLTSLFLRLSFNHAGHLKHLLGSAPPIKFVASDMSSTMPTTPLFLVISLSDVQLGCHSSFSRYLSLVPPRSLSWQWRVSLFSNRGINIMLIYIPLVLRKPSSLSVFQYTRPLF